MIRPSLVLLTLVAAFAVFAAPAQARVAYGVIGGSLLISFDTNAPGTLTSQTEITGKEPTEAIVALDVQPSTGQLYGLGSDSHLYTINTQTGVATEVGDGPFSPGISPGPGYGFDFNPVTGMIRVVGVNDENFELNPATGQVTTHPDLTPPAGTTISAAAYSNNYAGATTTTLFDIGQGVPPGDLFTQQLSPDDGALSLVGSLGIALGASTSFDIGSDNQAFAFSGLTLYSVNTATGTATSIGTSGFINAFALARPLQTTPFSASFEEPVGQPSAPTPITVTNTSDTAIPVAPALTGPGASQFTIRSSTCGTEIASGMSCTLGVSFKPTRPGPESATLSLGASQQNNATVTLSGTGVGAAVSLSHGSLAFGTQAIGSPSAPRTVVVTNTGNAALSVANVALGGDVRDFALRSQSCTGVPIAAGASCELSVAFDPISSGAKSAHVQLVDNAGSQQVHLSGTGAPAHVALSATSLSFPSTVVGQTSPVQTVTVRSTGEAPLTISSLALSGASTRGFAITGQTCTAAPVAPGAACTVSLRFAPLGSGAQSAVLHVNSDARGGQGTVNLAGTGARGVSDAAFGRARRGFGSVRVGRTSRIQKVVVRSSGSAPLAVRRLRLSGPNRSQFRLRSQTCTTRALAPGRRCAIKLSFRPTSAGRKRATLTIVDNVPGGGRIALSGRGRP